MRVNINTVNVVHMYAYIPFPAILTGWDVFSSLTSLYEPTATVPHTFFELTTLTESSCVQKTSTKSPAREESGRVNTALHSAKTPRRTTRQATRTNSLSLHPHGTVLRFPYCTYYNASNVQDRLTIARQKSTDCLPREFSFPLSAFLKVMFSTYARKGRAYIHEEKTVTL